MFICGNVEKVHFNPGWSSENKYKAVTVVVKIRFILD
jgi:hypothetical protein